MKKLLATAANYLQTDGDIPDSLWRRIRGYDRKHPMWSCFADDEMVDTWNALKGLGKV